MSPGRVIRRERGDGSVYWWTGRLWSDDPDQAKRYPKPDVAETVAGAMGAMHRPETIAAVSEGVRQ